MNLSGGFIIIPASRELIQNIREKKDYSSTTPKKDNAQFTEIYMDGSYFWLYDLDYMFANMVTTGPNIERKKMTYKDLEDAMDQLARFRYLDDLSTRVQFEYSDDKEVWVRNYYEGARYVRLFIGGKWSEAKPLDDLVSGLTMK